MSNTSESEAIYASVEIGGNESEGSELDEAHVGRIKKQINISNISQRVSNAVNEAKKTENVNIAKDKEKQPQTLFEQIKVLLHNYSSCCFFETEEPKATESTRKAISDPEMITVSPDFFDFTDKIPNNENPKYQKLYSSIEQLQIRIPVFTIPKQTLLLLECVRLHITGKIIDTNNIQNMIDNIHRYDYNNNFNELLKKKGI